MPILTEKEQENNKTKCKCICKSNNESHFLLKQDKLQERLQQMISKFIFESTGTMSSGKLLQSWAAATGKDTKGYQWRH